MAVNRSKWLAVSLLALGAGGCSLQMVETPEGRAWAASVGGRSTVLRVASGEATAANVPTEYDDHLRLSWGHVTLEKKAGDGKKLDLWSALGGTIFGALFL